MTGDQMSIKGYQIFTSIKKHFESDQYDYFKYHGKVRVPGKINSVYSYEKLANMKDPEGVVLANIIDRDIKWIQDITASDESMQTYLGWLKRQNTLTYTFKNDLDMLDDNFDANFAVNGDYPALVKLVNHKKITIETFTILCDMVGCLPYWNKKIPDTIIFPATSLRAKKYAPFLKYDKAGLKKIVLERFSTWNFL